jgi:hypothetical protein
MIPKHLGSCSAIELGIGAEHLQLIGLPSSVESLADQSDVRAMVQFRAFNLLQARITEPERLSRAWSRGDRGRPHRELRLAATDAAALTLSGWT